MRTGKVSKSESWENGLAQPKILGIVNITADSFSDGGLYLDPEKAIEQGVRLSRDGADAVDLGAVSSNPESKPISPEEEQRRLDPVIRALQSKAIPVSVDSFQLESQRFALRKKVDYLNDIQGFADPQIYHELADADCRLIVMHSVQRFGKARRVMTDTSQIMPSILTFFSERLDRLTAGGVARERIIIDPGMGFFLGSNPGPSIMVLRQIADLKREFDLPVLISVSRKSFLRSIAGRSVSAIGPATLAAEIFSSLQGVDYIRTHDVRALTDALKVLRALTSD